MSLEDNIRERRLLDKERLVEASPRRVILHWTAGSNSASNFDRQFYHLLVEGNGNIVWGHHDIAANDNTRDSVYAAHVRGANTGAIGVSLCGMAESRERPFNPGPYPITHAQYEIACRAIAELCDHYDIPVSRETVMNHGMVENNIGIKQRSKWDVCKLPWRPSLSFIQVDDHFRSRVAYYLKELRAVQGSVPVDLDSIIDEDPSDRLSYIVTARSGLNVREAPTKWSNKAEPALPKGETVFIVKEVDSWGQLPSGNWVWMGGLEPVRGLDEAVG
jgi:hypothetical protein